MAVSVLPTPLGPTNMNTPTGLPGSSKSARKVRTRRAMASKACGWPTKRSAMRSCRCSTVCNSSAIILPTGMPVQSEMTEATVPESTQTDTKGSSSCKASRPFFKRCNCMVTSCGSCSSSLSETVAVPSAIRRRSATISATASFSFANLSCNATSRV